MKHEITENPTEETLDPNDWESTRKLGHKMVDDIVNYLKTVRERPVWQKIPDEVKSQFTTPLPIDPEQPEEVYKEFVEKVLPYPMGNIHPRFWGWILGTGTITGAYAELLAAAMNTNNGGGNHIANYVEKQVIDWIKEMLQFTPSASGVLTSGCSASNLIGLTVARNSKAGFNIRQKGKYYWFLTKNKSILSVKICHYYIKTIEKSYKKRRPNEANTHQLYGF